MNLAIYGLFSESGECLYVGKTSNLIRRQREHRQRLTFSEARILKLATPFGGNRDERETIRRYRALGQAKLNVAPTVHFVKPIHELG